MKRIALLTLGSILGLLLFSQSVAAQRPNDILGRWYTEDNKSIVKVYKNASGGYDAKIVWLRDSIYTDGPKQGQPRLDDENDNEKLRKRTIKGIVFMKNFRWDPDDKRWEGDHLYDPESGNTYKGYMELEGARKLELRGYVGVPMFGRSSEWRRAN